MARAVPKALRESKEERFIRIAPARVRRVLRTVKILSNCSNRSAYAYNAQQVEEMFEAIQRQLNVARSKFQGPTAAPEFEFSEFSEAGR